MRCGNCEYPLRDDENGWSTADQVDAYVETTGHLKWVFKDGQVHKASRLSSMRRRVTEGPENRS